MSTVNLDLTELSEFNTQILRLVHDKYPKEAKNFLRKAGNKMRSNLRSAYKRKTRKKTGNLLKGVMRSPVYIYRTNEYQVRVYNKAPHAHLIERGHVYYWRGRPTDKYVKGRHIVGIESQNFDKTFVEYADKFVDELLKKGFA